MTDHSDTTSATTVRGVLSGLARGWWLIVAMMIVGAVVGGVLALSKPKQSEATSSVYLGQPTDANGNSISGISSNPKAALELAHSDSVLAEAARQVGQGATITWLRTHVTLQTPTVQTRTSSSPTNYVTITVSDTKPKRGSQAANAIAQALVRQLSSFADQKISLLEQEIAAEKTRAAAADTRRATAEQALAAVAAANMTLGQRAVASTPYLTLVQAAESELQLAQQALFSARLGLAIAQSIELPRVLSPASPGDLARPGLKLDIVAGLIVGLVVGCAAALVWQVLRRRDRGGAPEAAARS